MKTKRKSFRRDSVTIMLHINYSPDTQQSAGKNRKSAIAQVLRPLLVDDAQIASVTGVKVWDPDYGRVLKEIGEQ
jgi:hypothetical protein